MILGILLWVVILFSLYMAFKRPYVFALLYIWLDFFRPQLVAPKLFADTQFTVVAGVLAVIGLILASPRQMTRLSIDLVLMLSFALLITVTTYFSIFPDSAWVKWDWAVKALIFAALLGHFTTDKKQLEAAMLVMISASLGQLLAYGAKTVVGGGGYSLDLGLLGGNTGLGESSTLAVYCALLIPIIVFLGRHSLILPDTRARLYISRFLVAITVVAAIGTHARTAILSISTSLLGISIRRKAAMSFFVTAILLGLLTAPLWKSTDWGERMATTFSYAKDDSAMGRVAVWLWTLELIKDKPLGGGFTVDRGNEFTIETAGEMGQLTVKGKAFHSIYFEVLGEQGIPGFIIYFAVVAISITRLFRIWRSTKRLPDRKWEHELSYALLTSWAALLLGGAFVGIAYLPIMFLMMAFSNALFRIYLARLGTEDTKPAVPVFSDKAGINHRQRTFVKTGVVQ